MFRRTRLKDRFEATCDDGIKLGVGSPGNQTSYSNLQGLHDWQQWQARPKLRSGGDVPVCVWDSKAQANHLIRLWALVTVMT